MQKMDGKTMAIVDENILKLKEIFPEAFKEGKIDFEMLQKLLGENIETENERYSFTWNGKSDAIKIALKQSTGTLRPDKESSKNWDTTKNLYIEGDNLEVLRLLQSPYRGKIKMIYIDPPYNTGNDFVYNDKFNDTIEDYKERVRESQKTNVDTSGRYHTNWLNMMYPRLKLARNLLKDDGVIFISIDDNEVHNLRKLGDEIFGEDNFIIKIARKTVQHVRVLADYELQKLHDYVLVYVKNKSKIKFKKKISGIKKYEYEDESGKYTLKSFQNSGEDGTRAARPNLYYPIFYNSVKQTLELEEGENSEMILPRRIMNQDGRWLWSKERFIKDKNFLEYRNGTIYRKEYFSEKEDQNKYQAERNWLTEFPNRLGANTLRDLKLNGMFNYPKPVELLKFLINLNFDKDSIILDFFSGSATTAHAVMKLNSEDSGNRKFICVQLPEITDEKSEAYKAGYKNICEIGKERIRRAGEQILKELKDKQKVQKSLIESEEKAIDPDKLDIGFKVFKLDTTNLTIWDEKTDNLKKTLLDNINAIKDDRTQEDLLYEILIKYGIDLTVPIKEEIFKGKKIYLIADGYLTICLKQDLDLSFIEKLAERKPERVVFRDNGFKDDTVKINAEMTLKKYGVEDIKVL